MAVKELKRRKTKAKAKTTAKRTIKRSSATKPSEKKKSTPASSESSREKIISAALELFAENGYNGASIRQIAARAGISLGLMYNYFEGKEGLLQYIFSQGFSEIQNAFNVEDPNLSPTDQLESFIRKNIQLIQSRSEFYRLFYSLKLQPAALANLSDELQQWEQSIISNLSSLFQKMDSTTPDLDARIFVSTIEGLGHVLVLNPQNIDIEATTEAIIKNYKKPDVSAPSEEKIDKELSEIGKKLKALSKPISKKVRPAENEPAKVEQKPASIQGQLF